MATKHVDYSAPATAQSEDDLYAIMSKMPRALAISFKESRHNDSTNKTITVAIQSRDYSSLNFLLRTSSSTMTSNAVIAMRNVIWTLSNMLPTPVAREASRLYLRFAQQSHK